MSEQLKYKMQQWEAPPPPGCWEAIASRLDGAITPSPARLYDMEVAPPGALWNTIATALNKRIPTTAPVKRFYRNPYRLAAAASIVLLLGAGISWLAQNRTGTPIATLPVRPASSPAPPAANTVIKNNLQNNSNEEDNATTPGNNYTGYSSAAHKSALADARPMRSAAVSIQPAPREYPITVNYASMPDDNGTLTRNLDPSLTDNNYLVITGPNGEVTKASMKMADALRYFYENATDDNNDKTTNERKNWRNRLQQWRNKIISSHFIPASANFLDIIDLKDLIDEKQ